MEARITWSGAVSMANFKDKKSFENEDFISVLPKESNGYLQWVLCDGAGGSGVFCKEWAAYLGDHIPVNPGLIEQQSLTGWLKDVSGAFHDEVIAHKDLSDLVLQQKVYYTGSYSTLCACWIDRPGHEIFFCAVGDSCIFYFEAGADGYELEYLTSINRQDHVDAPPDLLNWNEKTQQQLPLHSLALEREFVVVMASDSLAKWVLLNLFLMDFASVAGFFSEPFLASLQEAKYEQQKMNIRLGSGLKTVGELIGFLKMASENDEKFELAMIMLAGGDEMDVDDYSLLIMEGNVS